MSDKIKKVLIIEDDPTYLKFWGRFLKQLGIESVGVKLLAEAAKVLDEENICFIIADVILPDGNGYEVLGMLSSHQANIPIIFSTAYGANLSRFNFPTSRFHLLHKPFRNLPELQRLIMHMIAGQDVFSDAAKGSHTDNEDMPEVTEWNL